MFPAPPNPPQPNVYDPDDEELLLAELAYSPMFARFINLILVPRIKELRDKLLRTEDILESERRGFVIHLLELERMLERVYDKTEVGEMPPTVRALFH